MHYCIDILIHCIDILIDLLYLFIVFIKMCLCGEILLVLLCILVDEMKQEMDLKDDDDEEECRFIYCVVGTFLNYNPSFTTKDNL